MSGTFSRMTSVFSCGRPESDDQDAPLTQHVTCKVMVVGDGAVGKTSLLTRFVTDQFDERYEPTIFENQAAPVTFKNKTVLLNLFDTAGQEGYEHLRPFMYPETDTVLVCFSVDSTPSLSNVLEKWVPEVRLHLPKVPLLVVGLKTDLRNYTDNGNNQHSQTLNGQLNGNLIPESSIVSYNDGLKAATESGAKGYFECSSKDNVGVGPVFREAGRLSLKHRRRSSIRSLFSPRISRSSMNFF